MEKSRIPYTKKNRGQMRKRFNYSFLNPFSPELKSFSRKGRNFKYFEAYHLKQNGNVSCGEGAILVEWNHKMQDKYIVHAVNVPVGDTSTRSVKNVIMSDVSPAFSSNSVESGESIYFLFDFYKTPVGINMRVRHLPTFVEIKAWNNTSVPNLSLIRTGHEQELRNFLGSEIIQPSTHNNSPFGGLLLNRVEKECGAH